MTDTLDADVGSLFGEIPRDDPGGEAVAEQPQAQPDPQPEPEAPADPLAEPDPAPIQQPEEPKGAHHVPLAVLLDEREKRKEYERKLREYEEREAKRQAEAAPQAIPDPYEDPQGYQAHVQREVQQQAFNLRAEMSGRFAEQKFGKDAVEAAIAWAQTQTSDPFLGQRVQASPSPVEFVVEQYNREQFYQKHGSDPSALQQLVATQGTAAPQPTAAQPLPKPQAPPKSLAAAPNAGGGHQAIPDGAILGSIKLNLD